MEKIVNNKITKDNKDLFLELILKNLELKQCLVTPSMYKHIKQFNLETSKPYTGKNKLLLVLLAEYSNYLIKNYKEYLKNKDTITVQIA